MEECIEFLGEATVFWEANTNQKYWRNEIRKEDQNKTYYISPRPLLFCSYAVWFKERPTDDREGSQPVAIRTDRFSKLTPVLPTAVYTNENICFFEAWVGLYKIPSHPLPENRRQFVRIFFGILGTFPGTKHETKAAYHSQTNRCEVL